MSYWFELTTEKYAILVSDKRRTYSGQSEVIDDAGSKIIKVNNSIYLTGAGLLPFVEDVAKDFRGIFKSEKVLLKKLQNSYIGLQGKLTEKYDWYHNKVLSQMEEQGLNIDEQKQQCTSVAIGAVSQEGSQFLLVGYSIEFFKIHEQQGSGKFICLPPLNDNLLNIFKSIKGLIKMAEKALNEKNFGITEIKRRSLELLPPVIHKVSSRMPSVSKKGDIAIIGSDDSCIISFN